MLGGVDFKPAPDRLVVRLADAPPTIGGTATGEIVAIGDDLVHSPNVHYEVGDAVLFGRSGDMPVFKLGDGADLAVLSAADVLTALPVAPSAVKIVEPPPAAAQAAPPPPPSAADRTPVIDLSEYISTLRKLAQ
jgi:co-chaperonin GroES (HSP10)